jgi:2',3'-cyclic-nucleotide 2'-phosphodiesterase (5'-nucleotidase family)
MNIKKIITRGLLVFVSIGLILSFTAKINAVEIKAAETQKKQDAETRIIIFHMNDAHAQIDNFGKIAWLLNQARKTNPNVFLMNAGDNFSGNPVVDQYVPKGEPILKLLNQLKTDVLTLGNHDFDYGQQILESAIKNARYPVLCANVEVKSGIIPQPKPYTLLETENGIKIAVLGLIQIGEENQIPSTHPDKVKGLVFSGGIETARKFTHLKNESDIFIALTHLGYDQDELLAKAMGELDIIIGGHSHTAITEPVEINGVLITQAGGYGKYLGRIEVIVKKGKVIHKKGELIELASIKNEIPEIKNAIKKYNNNPLLERVIITLPMVLVGKVQLGNLVTDAVRNRLHVDIAIHNRGGIRSDRLGKKVRIKDVFKLLPFGNDIVQFEMTPAEIKSLITFSYEKRGGLDLLVSGIEYTVLLTPGYEMKDVELKDTAGRLLDEGKTYKVGMNNYIASSYTFAHHDPGKSLQTIAAQALIDYLKHQQGRDICKDIEKIRIHQKEVKK